MFHMPPNLPFSHSLPLSLSFIVVIHIVILLLLLQLTHIIPYRQQKTVVLLFGLVLSSLPGELERMHKIMGAEDLELEGCYEHCVDGKTSVCVYVDCWNSGTF